MPQPGPPTPATPRPSRRERRRGETRTRLFRAALRLFAERGFTATTVEDITEAADVGKGTFFNYFPSKEHVLGVLGEIQRGKVELAAGEARAGQQPVRQVLDRLVHALAEEPGRSPALFRSLIVANFSSEAVREILARNLTLGRKALAEIVALGQQRSEVRRDRRPEEMARIFQQTFFGTLLLWATCPPSRLGRWLDATFEVFWTGVSAGPHRKKSRRERA